jgi:hypothetical protein
MRHLIAALNTNRAFATGSFENLNYNVLSITNGPSQNIWITETLYFGAPREGSAGKSSVTSSCLCKKSEGAVLPLLIESLKNRTDVSPLWPHSHHSPNRGKFVSIVKLQERRNTGNTENAAGDLFLNRVSSLLANRFTPSLQHQRSRSPTRQRRRSNTTAPFRPHGRPLTPVPLPAFRSA